MEATSDGADGEREVEGKEDIQEGCEADFCLPDSNIPNTPSVSYCWQHF